MAMAHATAPAASPSILPGARCWLAGIGEMNEAVLRRHVSEGQSGGLLALGGPVQTAVPRGGRFRFPSRRRLGAAPILRLGLFSRGPGTAFPATKQSHCRCSLSIEGTSSTRPSPAPWPSTCVHVGVAGAARHSSQPGLSIGLAPTLSAIRRVPGGGKRGPKIHAYQGPCGRSDFVNHTGQEGACRF